MKAPDNYPDGLDKFLDTVVEQIGVPQKKFIDYYCADTWSQFCLLLGSEQRNFFLGDHRIVNYNGALKFNTSQKEISQDYQFLIEDTDDSINFEFYKRYDNYIFSSDALARLDLKRRAFSEMNLLIEYPRKFYIFEWRYSKRNKLAEVGVGENYNWSAYRNWFKLNSSHKHTGHQILDYGAFRITDLSPEY